MKQINQYIFNIYHFILNVRDTMEYAIERDHNKAIFDNRKKVISENLNEGTAFGNFLKNNGEAGDKIKEQVNAFLDDFYGPDQKVLTVAGDKVRVDYSQAIKIYEGVLNLSNPLRDILTQYVAMSRQQKDDEPVITNLVTLDERMFRVVFTMLVMRTFEKSFAEFQKMMTESKGQPTPQSNFIVQNELFVMAKLLRDSRQHIHVTDNDTLDIIDDTLKVVEMTEGRRDRPGQKGFKEIFDDINRRLSEYVNIIEPQWKAAYDLGVKEMIEAQKQAQEAAANKDATDNGSQA